MTAGKKRGCFTPERMITCAVSSLFLSLSVLFFFPMEVMLKNIGDFHFSFNNVWGFQLAVAAAFAAVLFLVSCLLPRKWGLIFCILQVGGGLAAWVQAMLLNGSLAQLNGEENTVPVSQVILNALIWVVIIGGFVLAAVLLMKRGEKKTHALLRSVGGLLLIMQAGALLSLALTTDTSAYTINYRITDRDEFVVGEGTNVIEIVLDTADGEYADEMLEHYPELKESLAGWVRYPNAVSEYSRTYPSLTYMLSGEKCYFDTEPTEYVSKAFSGENFLKTLNENGTDIHVYSWHPELLGDEGIRWVSNREGTGNEKEKLDYYQLEKHLVRISLYRCMPYALKNLFEYRMEIVNISSFVYRPCSHFKDPAVYDALKESRGVTVSDKYQSLFKVHHLWSVHPGYYWNSDLEREGGVKPYDVLRGSFRVVEEYIKALKDAGVYDRTLFIVTADHGLSGGDREALERNRASCPLLMVKYPSADLSAPLAEDRAPVSHEDLFGTILDAFSIGGEARFGSGKKLTDYREGDERVRYHYYSALDDRTAEAVLVEYTVDGDATDFSSWHKTGNSWDILYSFNPVSELKREEKKQD